MEEQAVIDQIASLRFDADDRRVSRLMLAVVKRPRVVDLEIEVHRPGFLRLEAELEGDLLVRIDLLDSPESYDLHGSSDEGRDVLGRPVPLVRDVHLEAVSAVRLEPSVRRLEEQSRITVLQQSLAPRLRGHLGSLDEGLGPFQVLEAYRLFRLLQERLDVGEVRVDGVCGRHRVPDPFHVGARPVQDGPPALAGERFFRAPEVLVHLSRVLLLDCALDLREVRLRLPDIQVLALRDRDIVDQGRALDLDLLRGDLALLPFVGFVEALLDLPDALVDAFELVQEARPLLEDVPVSVLDLFQDLEHVQREQLRLLADDDRGEERVGRTLDQDLGVPEVEAFHADARARLERVFHEVLDDREHAGEDVLVDLLAELAAIVRDEPSVGMDQEDVLDQVGRLRFDLDLLRVADFVPVLVEEPLVGDPDRHGDRARAFRPDADPDRDDLAHADLRNRSDALRLEVA